MLNVQVETVNAESVDCQVTAGRVGVVEGARLIERCPRILYWAKHAPELIRKARPVSRAVDIVRASLAANGHDDLLVAGLSARVQVLLQVRADQKLVLRGVLHAFETRSMVRFGATLVTEVDAWVAVGLFGEEMNEREDNDINSRIGAVRGQSLLIRPLALSFQPTLVFVSHPAFLLPSILPCCFFMLRRPRYIPDLRNTQQHCSWM